ncbi:hypothetical protein C8R44DRAFT_869561 [Mycena epipterygia]|nr:hypothetical protein C8R44DRAFT_869561 [Mycena epipterygia]
MDENPPPVAKVRPWKRMEPLSIPIIPSLLALPLVGIWHFACKPHVDVKRIYCRFGSIASVRDATAQDEAEWGKFLDNVQEYSPVYEHGLGPGNQLKVGTACTAFRCHDCKPGAWDANDHIARIVKQ